MLLSVLLFVDEAHGLPTFFHLASCQHDRLLQLALQAALVAHQLGHIVVEVAVVDVALGAFQLFADEVGEEAVLLLVVAIHVVLHGGGVEDDDIVAQTQATRAFGVVIQAHQYLAVALIAVEAGIEDESNVVGNHAVEPAAQRIHGQALLKESLGVALAQLRCHVDVSFASPSAHAAQVHAAGYDVRIVVVVRDAVAAVIYYQTGIAAVGTQYVLQPIDALLLNLCHAGVLDDAHVTLGNAQRLHKVFSHYRGVSPSVGTVGERCLVVFVGDDDGVGIFVAAGLVHRDVVLDELVVDQYLVHVGNHLVEGGVQCDLHAAAAECGALRAIAAGDVLVAVVCFLQRADVLQIVAYALGAQIGQLCVRSDADAVIYAHTDVLAVEMGGLILIVAILSAILHALLYGRFVRRAGYFYAHLLAVGKEIVVVLSQQLVGYLAQSQARVRLFH